MSVKGDWRRPDTRPREWADPLPVPQLPSTCDCGGPVFRVAQRIPDPTLRWVGRCHHCRQRYHVPA